MIGVGLLGYGLAGRSFHAPLIRAVEGLRLQAVVTRDPERAEQARRENPGARIAGDVAAVMGEPSIDLVVVATPNRLHVPQGIAALEAGRHVVVDKPIATGSAEAERLVAAARRTGRLLTVYQNRRWDGDFLTVRRLLDEGTLGRIDSFESRFEGYQPVVGGWRDLPEEAGGPLHDLGAHLVDQAVQLLGPVRAVYAELEMRRPETRVPDSVFLSLTHASGARSRLWSSHVSVELGPRFLVRGLAGEYVKSGRDPQEPQAIDGLGPEDPGWGLEPEERWGTMRLPGATPAERRVPTARGAYQRFYELLRDAIADGGPPPVDPADAIAVLRVLEAAVVSARERRAVDL